MEFPEERYYGLNRILLSVMGLWPYDNYKVRQFRFILTLLIMISFISTQFIKLCVSNFNSDFTLKILAFQLIVIMSSAKYITVYTVMDNIKEFRERIWNNWSALTDSQEIEIICKHGNIGKLLTIILTLFMYAVGFFYISIQYVTMLLYVVIPLNESHLYEPLFPAEYFIDQKEYFHIILIHTAIGVLIFVTSIIATESFSVTNAIHAFGLFKVASYRMEHILTDIDPQMCLIQKQIISRNRIIAAVDFHRRAIEFSELLKASFGNMYLFMFVISVFSMSLGSVYLSRIIMMKKKIFESISFTLLVVAIIALLTIANYAGQEFINCDTHFYRTICNMKWYNAPLKTQKLIFFIIQKTTKCYKVDAGGMFNPCLEGLATAISMSVSYFTLVASI